MLAVRNGHADLVKSLMELKADPRRPDAKVIAKDETS